MIVKILKASAKFSGVRYNTNKMDNGKGELMKVSGFGPLQAYSQLLPEDYVKYLELVSGSNKRIKLPQFHAVISAKGREMGKDELTDLAVHWLEKMGYKDQPYLVVFHKDTKNNHVHLVSTRVDKQGKKISSAFEKVRAVAQLNRLMKLDEYHVARQDLTKALLYNFSTRAQFMMILESHGYMVSENAGKLELIKFGKKLADVELSAIKFKQDDPKKYRARATQLTGILHKYRKQYSGVLKEETTPLPGGLEKRNASYTSDLAVYMSKNHGVQLRFHGKVGMPAYGFSVIDHAEGNVYKGGEIMDLSVLTEEVVLEKNLEPGLSESVEFSEVVVPDPEIQVEYLQSAEPGTAYAYGRDGTLPSHTFEPYHAPIDINISDDIDDEAILGRNRRRKKKARTNSR